jgi:hypothetical protein
MAAIYFRVGDWVKVRTAGPVPQGTVGIVRQALISVPGMYYVQFDGYNFQKLMHQRDLERVRNEPQKPRAA